MNLNTVMLEFSPFMKVKGSGDSWIDIYYNRENLPMVVFWIIYLYSCSNYAKYDSMI